MNAVGEVAQLAKARRHLRPGGGHVPAQSLVVTQMSLNPAEGEGEGEETLLCAIVEIPLISEGRSNQGIADHFAITLRAFE